MVGGGFSIDTLLCDCQRWVPRSSRRRRGMVEKLIPLAYALTFFGSKKHFSNKILKIYLHPTPFELRCMYSMCCRVYVTYIFSFKPTPFGAFSLKKRLKDWLNHQINNVFAIDRKY